MMLGSRIINDFFMLEICAFRVFMFLYVVLYTEYMFYKVL